MRKTLTLLCLECGRVFRLDLTHNPEGECPTCGSADVDLPNKRAERRVDLTWSNQVVCFPEDL